jgi:CRP/FNR family cyclic AMP-dependent transcriptional regulator
VTHAHDTDPPGPNAEIPPALRRALDAHRRELFVRRGRTIVSAGARQDTIFFVRDGEARVLLFSSNGREVSVRSLGAGDIVGELAALDGLPRSASVLAVSDVRVRILPKADFLACLEASPEAALWLAQRLGTEVRRLTEKVFELSALNVRARLHCELLRLARGPTGPRTLIAPAPTHAELANRIGTHREAVTREMRALAEMSIVRSRRRSLEFIDLAALERAVFREVGAEDELRTAS